MNTPTASDTSTPIYKVGLLLWRERAGAPEILIIQPKPKNTGEMPQFVLPRGSRQYWLVGADGQKTYHDIRDAGTARAHADRLEPLTRTLLREAEEEAGIDAKTLRCIGVRELGAQEFASRTKGIYPIHWFIAQADEGACVAMKPVPDDALAVRWASEVDIQATVAAGEFSAGYLPVITEGLAKWDALPAASLWE